MPFSGNTSITRERRRAIFQVLVEAQDQGMTVVESRKHVATAFSVPHATVERVEQEGIEKEWSPPSEAAGSTPLPQQ